jgi:hypothetical protein
MIMTKEEQRIAIGEWMGWTWQGDKSWEKCSDWYYCDWYYWSLNGVGTYLRLPNYPEDLNAIHEAVFKLSLLAKVEYSVQLRIVVSRFHVGWETLSPLMKNYYAENAAAPQRSEAFCRTLWPERWKE